VTRAIKRFLGPGTVLALVVAIALLASGKLAPRPPADPAAGRIVYEADAAGHMRRVASPTISRSGPFKPEPSLLLNRSARLGLTAPQREAIRRLDLAWQRENCDIGRQLAAASSAAREQVGAAHGASASRVAISLREYSALSRTYDERRGHYWRLAWSQLSERQQRLFSRAISAGVGR
jgi:hypothetical protein